MISVSAPSATELYQRLLRHALNYKGVFAIAVLGMLTVSAGETAFAWLMKPIMDQGFVARDQKLMVWLPYLLVGVMFVRGIGQFIDTYCMDWVGRRVIYDLRQQMFERMIRMPAAFFDQNTSSTLVSQLIFDVEQVSRASTEALRVFVRDSLFTIMLLGLMFYHSWKTTLGFLLIVPPALLILRVASKRFRKTSHRIQDTMSDITHHAKEAFQGQELIKAFGGHKREDGVFERANEDNRRHFMKRSLVSAISVPLTIFIAGIGLAVIIWYALNQSGDNQISAGTFVSYITAAVMLMQPLRRLSKVNEVIQTGVAASASIFGTLDRPPEADLGTEEFSAPVAGDIVFDQVSFHYPEVKAAALNGVSFSVKAKTKTALVGMSGSGKTTAMKLLMRLYGYESGEIRIDRQDISQLTLAALREQIAIVPQKTILFDDSIKNNIIYGASKWDEAHFLQVVKAARVAEFAERLPEAYDTEVGENGARLSGGQQQRMGIARALYKNAPILILDEATSSLDSRSEQKIQAAVDQLLENRTSLIIAHRLSTIQDADLILVFDQGELVEQGTHQTLLARQAHYYQLYTAQQNQRSADKGSESNQQKPSTPGKNEQAA